MKIRISTTVGKWQCEVDASVAAEAVEKVMRRSMALAFPAALASKQAGGKIADFGLLTQSDIEARFAKRASATNDVAFSNLAITPYVAQAPSDPMAMALRALGAMTAEQKAAFQASVASALAKVA